jgi:hypothetical protein
MLAKKNGKAERAASISINDKHIHHFSIVTAINSIHITDKNREF